MSDTRDRQLSHDATDDPLSIGDLISLQEAAEYAGLEKGSLHNYAKSGRLKAKKLGPIWVTTKAAIDEYLQSRQPRRRPKSKVDK